MKGWKKYTMLKLIKRKLAGLNFIANNTNRDKDNYKNNNSICL